jgi:hypothetical protein
MTNVEKLAEKFEELKTQGLKDFKILPAGSLQGADLEVLCGEVLAMIAAHENGNHVDITKKLT